MNFVTALNFQVCKEEVNLPSVLLNGGPRLEIRSADTTLWIPDSISGWIPDSISWIPDSTDQNYLDSGLPYMGRTVARCSTHRANRSAVSTNLLGTYGWRKYGYRN